MSLNLAHKDWSASTNAGRATSLKGPDEDGGVSCSEMLALVKI